MITYQVKPGDTLSKILSSNPLWKNLTYEEVMLLNPEIKDPNLIKVNQVIKLPSDYQTLKAAKKVMRESFERDLAELDQQRRWAKETIDSSVHMLESFPPKSKFGEIEIIPKAHLENKRIVQETLPRIQKFSDNIDRIYPFFESSYTPKKALKLRNIVSENFDFIQTYLKRTKLPEPRIMIVPEVPKPMDWKNRFSNLL